MAKKSKQGDIAALAALLGIEAPKDNKHETTEDVSREAEAALAYADSPKSFIRKECKSCGRTFAHTRGAVAYCSNACRARNLEQIGIKWDWSKPPETRWDLYGGGEPLVVPPEAVKLVDQVSDTQEHLKCPVYNHMRDQSEHGSWCWGDSPVPEGMVMVPYGEPALASVAPDPEPETEIPSDALDILKELGLS